MRMPADPLLINGAKFDIRIYVTVTCFQPLRVYVHEQGLVRLCTAAYNASSKMSNRKNKFSHLTNYAVNRDNANFVLNASVDEDDKGHKWSLRALHAWMREHNIDPDPIFRNIDKLIVKTLVAVEVPINTHAALCTPNRNTCFELLGFDVMIDSAHKPWLLEVNTSPSLACDTPLDAAIKSQVVRDTLNLARLQQYSRVEADDWVEHQRRLRMQGERNNRRQLADNMRRRDVCSGLISPLADLTDDDADVIREAEDELARRGEFRRVFPRDDAVTREVTSLFETRRFHNLLLFHWTTRGNTLTVEEYLDGKHLTLKNFDPSFKAPPLNPNNSNTTVSSPPPTIGGREEKARKDLGSGASSCQLRANKAEGGRSMGMSGAVMGGPGERDRGNEASHASWRANSQSHCKLSATQAERHGLLTDQFRKSRAASPATCSQRNLTLDLMAKQQPAGAPLQLPATQQQQQQQQQQQAWSPQKRPLQQKQMLQPATPPQSRLPGIPSPQRSPKLDPSDARSNRQRCADEAGVDGAETDTRQALDDSGDILSVASTEASAREERGDVAREGQRGFYTLYGMEVSEVGVGMRCGRTGQHLLRGMPARSAPASPSSPNSSRLSLPVGDRAQLVLTPGGQPASRICTASVRSSPGSEGAMPSPTARIGFADKSAERKMIHAAETLVESSSKLEAGGLAVSASTALAMSPCSLISKLSVAARVTHTRFGCLNQTGSSCARWCLVKARKRAYARGSPDLNQMSCRQMLAPLSMARAWV